MKTSRTLSRISWALFGIGNLGMAILFGYIGIFMKPSMETLISDIIPAVLALIICDGLIIFMDISKGGK